jgi:G6PDH family F420-dependent oxidoreductase
VGTAVTCPTIRIHPAIIAHAAATAAALMPGRFFLGVGTGENLNEHILGQGWPSPEVRLEMLEAIEVIRLLWAGGTKSHRGRYYTVQDARLYSLPDEPPPIMVAASKPHAAELAGRRGDAMTLHRTRPARSLRGGLQTDHREAGRRGGDLRARRQATRRRDQEGSPRRVHPRVRAPDRAPARGLHRALRA